MSQLEDGTGTGNRAKIRSNRLHVDSISRTELHSHIDEGKTWNISTGEITLTSASESALLYMKNTGQNTLFVNLYVIISGASTGGSGNMPIKIYRTPTAGTLITTATPVTSDNINNMNFGSANVPDAIIYSGVEGDTLTGESGILRSQTTADNRLLLGILTSVPIGASVGISVTPPVGNTSIVCEVVLEMFEETHDD
jgi:hypothetical protein